MTTSATVGSGIDAQGFEVLRENICTKHWSTTPPTRGEA